MELVIQCARAQMGDAEKACLQSLLQTGLEMQTGLDWPRVLQIASVHRVSLLLYRSLKSCGADHVPPSVMSELRVGAMAASRHSLLLVGELVAILTLFAESGIQALPFKGPAVAYSLYGGLGRREFGDLDILIREKDVPQATALLVARGYDAPDQIADTINRPFLQFYPFLESPSSQGSLDFYRSDGNVVELHWRFTPRHFPFPLASPDLWDRLVWVELPGLKALNLSSEDMLLLLCVHGSKHCWQRLSWICDVAELVRTAPEINWNIAFARARYLRVERMIYVGLMLSADVLGAAVPDVPLQAARQEQEAVRLAARIEGRLRHTPLDPLREIEEYQFTFRVREVALDRLRYLLHLLVTPVAADWNWLPLPGSLSTLYYLIRPIRLSLVYLRRLFS